jgi:hypothetical protein
MRGGREVPFRPNKIAMNGRSDDSVLVSFYSRIGEEDRGFWVFRRTCAKHEPREFALFYDDGE